MGEKWEEISARDGIALQVYECHEECTSRVNQMWTWSQVAGRTTTDDSLLHAYGGHILSPGLMKCWDVEGSNLQIKDCRVAPEQKFEVVDGMITTVMDGKTVCLTASDAAANAQATFEVCNCDPFEAEEDSHECAAEMQAWVLSEGGSIALDKTEFCLDVKAEQKSDGSYENWEEIKAHDVNTLHLYDCHEAGTERVNQLWEWSPIGNDELHAILAGERQDCQHEELPDDHQGYISPDHHEVLPDEHKGYISPDHQHHHHHHSHGSMPESEDEALDMEMDDLVENYQVGQVSGRSLVGVLAVAGVAVTLVLVVGLYKFNARRSAMPDESQLLNSCE